MFEILFYTRRIRPHACSGYTCEDYEYSLYGQVTRHVTQTFDLGRIRRLLKCLNSERFLLASNRRPPATKSQALTPTYLRPPVNKNIFMSTLLLTFAKRCCDSVKHYAIAAPATHPAVSLKVNSLAGLLLGG